MNRLIAMLVLVPLAACARTETPAASPHAAPSPAPAAAPAASTPAAPAVPAVAPVPARAAAAPTPPVALMPETATLPPAGPTRAQAGEPIPGFRAKVRRGTASADFDSRAGKTVTVYVIDSPTCPTSQTYAPRVKDIETAFAAKGVDFVHVYPLVTETQTAKVEWHTTKGFPGGQILDPDGSITKSLTATKTPTVVVADAKGVVVYRGAVDDQADLAKVTAHYLTDALDATLAGRPVTLATTPAVG